jgi:DNA-binding transcriptional ArsR family regulator
LKTLEKGLAWRCARAVRPLRGRAGAKVYQDLGAGRSTFRIVCKSRNNGLSRFPHHEPLPAAEGFRVVTAMEGSATMTETDEPGPAFANPTRAAIYAHVQQWPGVHMRQIHRELGLPLSTLEYHLHRMEAANKLITRRFRNFKSYFVRDDEMGREDRDYMYYLRQEMPRKLAIEILQQPGISFKELSDRVPVTSSTVSFHLRKLTEGEIVAATPAGRTKTYQLNDAQRVMRLLNDYQPAFTDKVVDRFADAWMDVHP